MGSPGKRLAGESRYAGSNPVVSAELLWTTSFFNVPLTGMAEVDDERCWFIIEDRFTMEPRWVLYKLTDEELDNESAWHALFEAKVGEKRDNTSEKEESYYSVDLDRPKRDYSKHPVIGWTDRWIDRRPES